MPFDGTTRNGSADEIRCAYDMLVRLERFFEGGSKWQQGQLRDGCGKYCLLGAIQPILRERDGYYQRGHDLVLGYLLRTARARVGQCPIAIPVLAAMNDSCRDFEELRDCLREAAALAAANLWRSTNLQRPPIHQGDRLRGRGMAKLASNPGPDSRANQRLRLDP
jgi:hypothetical protein